MSLGESLNGPPTTTQVEMLGALCDAQLEGEELTMTWARDWAGNDFICDTLRVVPTVYEGGSPQIPFDDESSNTLMEAMLAEKPYIITDFNFIRRADRDPKKILTAYINDDGETFIFSRPLLTGDQEVSGTSVDNILATTQAKEDSGTTFDVLARTILSSPRHLSEIQSGFLFDLANKVQQSLDEQNESMLLYGTAEGAELAEKLSAGVAEGEPSSNLKTTLETSATSKLVIHKNPFPAPRRDSVKEEIMLVDNEDTASECTRSLSISHGGLVRYRERIFSTYENRPAKADDATIFLAYLQEAL